MELARVQMARSIWLFDPEELNPRGKKVGPIFQSLKDRYNFTEPTSIEDLKPAANSVKFTGGAFTIGSDVIDVELELYNDGLVATSKSHTDHTDQFLSDLLSWLRQEHGFGNENYFPKPRRAHRSEVIVFAPTIKIASGIGKFLALTETIAKNANVDAAALEPEAIIFGSDARRGLFTFERRTGVPYSDHKYFSAAQMQTSKHLNVLVELEVALTDTAVPVPTSS
jgi:hypothetical protein